MDSNQATPSSRPCFTFAESLAEGALTAYSYGNGRFIPGKPAADQRVFFHLEKEADNLYIQIKDQMLLLWLLAIPWLCDGFEGDFEQGHAWISMDYVLPQYPELRRKFAEHKRQGHMFDAVELFVRHFLCEGSIFATFGFENLRERDLLTAVHFHDVQSQEYSICEDLDLLDEAMDKLEDLDTTWLTNSLANLSLQSLLHDSIERRDFTSVSKLLTMTPVVVDAESIWLAIECYEESVLRLLLDRGLQIEWVDPNAHLYHAANIGHIGAVRLLLAHYATERGDLSDMVDIALNGAASGGHLKIVRYLVEKKGAKFDGHGDITPLSRARRRHQKSVTDYLLRAGADSRKAELKCLKFLSAANILAERGIKLHEKLDLTVYPRRLDNLLRSATDFGDLDCLKSLVELKAELNPEGNCLACRAFREGHTEVGDWLRRAGASCRQYSWKSPDHSQDVDFLDLLESRRSVLPQWPSLSPLLSSTSEYDAGQFATTQSPPPEDDLGNCATIAAIRAQERASLERQLFARITSSRQKLLEAGARSNATSSLKEFVSQIGTASSIRKTGTRVIRDIVDGYIPARLFDIVCVLQVASAMRSIVSESKMVYSKKDFINDIPRWASQLSLQDQRLLDEIALSIWGTAVPTQEIGRSFTPVQNWEFLRKLVDKLARPLDHDFGSSWESGSYRLSTLRQRHTSANECDNPGEKRLPLRKWNPFPELDIPERVYVELLEPPHQEKEHSIPARTTFLMAGAIFGAIILYLCLLQWGLSTVHHLVLYPDTGQDWDSNQIMAQNCAILSKYAGHTKLVDSGVSMNTLKWLPYTPPDAIAPSGAFPADGTQTQGAIQSTCGAENSAVPPSSTVDAVMDHAPTGCSPSPQSRPETSPTATISPSTTIRTSDDSTTIATLVDGAISCEFPGCRSVFKLGRGGRRGQASNRQKHMKEAHSEDPVMYKCGTCGKERPNKWNMKDHEKRCARKKARRRERG